MMEMSRIDLTFDLKWEYDKGYINITELKELMEQLYNTKPHNTNDNEYRDKDRQG